ncbi:MAG: electron transfer flavoprotein subunit beta/FixA family protein [Desulfobaccales bacterium]
MNILVCAKQIIDPEIPPGDFGIDTQNHRVVQGKASLVISPFDENAIEMAIQLKQELGEGKVTVLTYGTDTARDSLYKALAMGADDAVLVKDERSCGPESYPTARVLAATIKKSGDYDLIMCGRQAGDWDAGQVGPLLAEELNLPCITFVCKIKGDKHGLRLQRQVDGGMEILETPLPALITVTNDEANVPRIPKVRDVMKAQSKKIYVWTLDNLGLSETIFDSENAGIELKELYIPVQENRCEFIEGEDGEQKAASLVDKLLTRKII